MKIFPAIDLRSSKVVRLTKGDYEKMDVYSSDPKSVAASFEKKGASYLHVVDLDGARDGAFANLEAVKSICEVKDLFVQCGGGVRDENRIIELLEVGVSRAILGTVAVRNYAFAKEMARKYGDKIAVGVDAIDGRVAVAGWLETTQVDSMEFCERLRDDGVKTVIYTDISRDGMMQGTNLRAYERLCGLKGLDVVASGGITYIEEIKKLSEMGIYGAILGKALYEGLLNLEEALTAAEDKK
ncbi:MAG: 1-(5-phosphoribosyl)-5-[(5-phosphoribosylamino)methylideneamino]imidazole-4-carboxamide isomerase [Christensenellales bacterium]|jgi:phosphoribosylformimino-5-aminoimidazole carboxamide ribotide isomerase